MQLIVLNYVTVFCHAEEIFLIERSSQELEEYSKSQNTIIQKLREECRLLVHKLEEVTHKYKLV